MEAVCSRQGLGTLRARTRPSGRRLVLLGTCYCAVVRCVLCALSGFAAPGGRCCPAPVRVPWLWPAACLSGVPRCPCLVRRASSGPVALSAPVGSPDAVVPFFTPGACTPGFTGYLHGARGGRPRTGLIVPAAGPCRGRGAGLAPRRTHSGPRDGVVPGGFSGVGLGLHALRWLACVDPVTDASGFPYRPSFDRGSGRCTGAVSCGRRHLPLRVGGRHARVPCMCAYACSSWPGQAGRPPGRVLVRLTFSFGCFVFLLCLAPSGLGLPPSLSLLLPFLVAFRSFVCSFFFFPLLYAPLVFGFLCFPAPGALGLGAGLCSSCALAGFVSPGPPVVFPRLLLPPPPLCVSQFSSFPLGALVFFSLSFRAPPLFSGSRPGVPWA